MTPLRHILPMVLLLGAFLAFSSWSAYRAATTGSRVSEPDYYGQGLSYDRNQAEQAAASARGWQLSVQHIGRRLEIRLSDGQHRPVENALGTVMLAPNPQPSALTAEPGGLYTCVLPDLAAAGVPVRVEFSQNGARLRRQLLLLP